MNIRRFASSLTFVAVLAAASTGAGGVVCIAESGFYGELVRAIEPSLPLGNPYPS